jgi:hypothetical protein
VRRRRRSERRRTAGAAGTHHYDFGKPGLVAVVRVDKVEEKGDGHAEDNEREDDTRHHEEGVYHRASERART